MCIKMSINGLYVSAPVLCPCLQVQYIFLKCLCCLSTASQSSKPYKGFEHRPVPSFLPPSLHPCPPLTSIWSGSALVLDLPPFTSTPSPLLLLCCHFCINKWSLTITLRPRATLLHFHPPPFPCFTSFSTSANHFCQLSTVSIGEVTQLKYDFFYMYLL